MAVRIDENLTSKSHHFFSYNSRDQEALASSPTLPNPLDSNYFRLCTGIWQSVRFDGVFSEAGFSIDSAV